MLYPTWPHGISFWLWKVFVLRDCITNFHLSVNLASLPLWTAKNGEFWADILSQALTSTCLFLFIMIVYTEVSLKKQKMSCGSDGHVIYLTSNTEVRRFGHSTNQINTIESLINYRWLNHKMLVFLSNKILTRFVP